MFRCNIYIEGFMRNIGFDLHILYSCVGDCDSCFLRFKCLTSNGDIILTDEEVRDYQKLKAKKQGHYIEN